MNPKENRPTDRRDQAWRDEETIRATLLRLLRLVAAEVARLWSRQNEPTVGGNRAADASMGPRPEDRGEPAVMGGRYVLRLELQWGHGPKTVENDYQHAADVKAVFASMGPRPEDRGERGAGSL